MVTHAGACDEGGAGSRLDCVGQSVKSALSLYVSCVTPLHEQRGEADTAGDTLNRSAACRTLQDFLRGVFGFCRSYNGTMLF